jgi:transcriptional regulator with XRE-family HTH domain
MSELLGRKIRELRESRGWSASELARRMGNKGARTTLSLWENDKRRPTGESLTKLAELLGVSVRELDPQGRAYNPARRGRARSKMPGIQDGRTPADTSTIAHTEEAGVLMDGGVPLPDADLFVEVLSVWRLLRTSEERSAFVEHARRYLGIESPRPVARKKAPR